MCGIAGFIDLKGGMDGNALAAEAKRMADALRHRGPDTGGQWTDGPAGLAFGFRRLSIIDLSQAGHQPMVSADERFVIVYNGEVYNFQELRAELESAGHVFRGHSDTEVILEACARWGVMETIPRLIGMFAMAVWDREERRLWLARDRLGIKPLFYGRAGDRFLFGSELKALRAAGGWTPEVDRDALAGYMRFAYVPAPQTIYKGIAKLEPGCLLSYGLGGEPEIRRYWHMAEVAGQAREEISDTDAIERLDTLLRDAVRRRMVADVPLGALLSGGVDSTTVLALMQAESDRPVRSFTIGFEDATYDEARDARQVAEHLGTEHTELYLSADRARDLIPELPDWYDEPFADSSALPTRLVSELARQDVTVALSGDGGDEVFFGYNRYVAAEATWRRTCGLPRWLRGLGAAGLTALSPGAWDLLAKAVPRSPRMLGDKLHKLAAILPADGPDAIYRRLVSQWDDPAALLAGGDEAEAPVWQEAQAIEDFAERMAFLDTGTYLPDDILAKVDRASMSVSLEVRVPLLDHRVVEFAWTLPKHMRIREGTTKWLLRQVCHRYVPKEIVERPKMGFAIPLDGWLRGPLRDWAEALLAESRLEQEGMFRPKAVRRAWGDFLAGRGNLQHGIWGVLQAQAWMERWA